VGTPVLLAILRLSSSPRLLPARYAPAVLLATAFRVFGHLRLVDAPRARLARAE
jgi:hypothetical protein